MDVYVKDGLTGLRPNVEHGPVALLNPALPADFGRDEMKAPDKLRIFFLRFFQAADMFFRDDEDVSGRLRVDVLEGKTMLVFIYFLGRNLALHNSAKEAISHSGSGVRCQVSGLRCQLQLPAIAISYPILIFDGLRTQAPTA
jgi:hypothetical protein